MIYADETIYSYKLNLNFGLQRHVTLSQKEPGRIYSLPDILEIHFLCDVKKKILKNTWRKRQWNHAIELSAIILNDFSSKSILKA